MIPNDAEAALARRALSLLDLTDLSDTAREGQVETLIQKALGPHGLPAAICIWPQFVRMAKSRLDSKGVLIATVVNFPKGKLDIDRVVDDTVEALDDGADEIDLVMPWRAFLSGNLEGAGEMVEAVKDCLSGHHRLKVILESGEYPDGGAVSTASALVIGCGADFLKTSTGKSAVGATPEAVTAMLDAIRESGRAVGVKVSGGVRTLADAALYLDLVDRTMGADWATPATFRFGASGLHDDILRALGAGATSRDGAGAY